MKQHLKKLVMTAGVLSIVLTGCSSDEGIEDIERAEPLSESDYPTAITEKGDEFRNEYYDTMVELVKEDEMNDERELDFKKRAVRLDDLSKEVVSIEAPAPYKEMDKLFEESMREFRIWLSTYKEALDTKKYHLFAENYDHTKRGNELYEEAVARLSVATGELSSSVSMADLNATLWTIEGLEDYRGMGFEADGTAWYTYNSQDGPTETYRGTWKLEGNTVFLEVNEAIKNSEEPMEDAPEKMEFEIITFSKEEMQMKQGEELVKYIRVE